MAVGEPAGLDVPPVSGVRLGTASAGIKTPGRRDLVILELCEGSTAAGVYTRNAFRAAPVRIARRHAGRAAPRYFLINTGNANAGTGEAGMEAALACCRAVAEHTGVEVSQVLPFSTGVIGEPLPVDRITAAIPDALAALDAGEWAAAAEGIMTTDTRPKAASRQLQFKGRTLTITGIAKGAGMIRPDMATMLAFVATDAGIENSLLQEMLERAMRVSFNRITVDGDTSTNDCCMLAATGASGLELPREETEDFQRQLDAVCTELAQGLIRDAEGATKFVSIRVTEAATPQEALRAAYTVAESPLVKTALFAGDPNWGRILAAVGRAGIDGLDIGGVDIDLGDVPLIADGIPAPGYTEEKGARVMARDEITIAIRLGRGACGEQVWTSDLSYEYVKINAEYRT